MSAVAPVSHAVRAGVSRRRLQTFVIGLVVLMSTAVLIIAVALIAVSNAPFDHAFASQRGADVAVTIDASKVTRAQLAATARLPGVTAAAGPFEEVTVTPHMDGGTLPPTALVARPAPGGPLDDLRILAGRWSAAPGQVVLDANGDGGEQFGQSPGTRLRITGLHGAQTLTVVGMASSVTASAGGWVAPAEIARLRAAGEPVATQMLYRFHDAASAAALRSDVATVARSLPAGALAGTETYLAVKAREVGKIAPFVPFLIAFGLIGIVMSVLIVANVVSGAVASGYRRIGILKSIGFTPGEVAAAYVGQVAVPALAGCAAGVALGNLIAVPLLATTATAFGVGSLHVPLWVDLAVPAGICGVAGLAALIPALRAGRLSPVAAIAMGRAPRVGRGYRAHRLLGRLPLPRSVSIGLAAPFARPGRSLLTLAAVVLGATAVSFAVGLTSSLRLIVAGLDRTSAQPVRVFLPGPGSGPVAAQGAGAQPPVSDAAAQKIVEAALRGQPGTRRFVAEAQETVSVTGLPQPVPVTVFRGDASWTGYPLVRGRWYSRPDEVVVPTGFLAATGKSVGDTITFLLNGRQTQVRIVGEVFDTENRGVSIVAGWQTIAPGDPGLTSDHYDVGLSHGTDQGAYVRALGQRLGPDYMVAINDRSSPVVDAMIGLIATLTLLLAVVAGLGVLNSVVLATRDRVHDLGVFKAIGMTPRQLIATIVCTVIGIGVVGGLVGAPAGVAVHHAVLPAMAAAAGLSLPGSFLDVYGSVELIALALAGTIIAIGGAVLPAGWAARASTANALHAE